MKKKLTQNEEKNWRKLKKKRKFCTKNKAETKKWRKKHMDLPWDQLIAFNKIPESRNTTYIFTYIYTYFYKFIRIFELWIKKRESYEQTNHFLYKYTKNDSFFFSFLDKITECTHSISISIGMHKYYEYLRILANK